jgi:hypothetical protein
MEIHFLGCGQGLKEQQAGNTLTSLTGGSFLILSFFIVCGNQELKKRSLRQLGNSVRSTKGRRGTMGKMNNRVTRFVFVFFFYSYWDVRGGKLQGIRMKFS